MVCIASVFWIVGLFFAIYNNDFGRNSIPYFVSLGFLALVIAGLFILSKALRSLHKNSERGSKEISIPQASLSAPKSTSAVPSFG
jgi:type VI protein secretion system component VasK